MIFMYFLRFVRSYDVVNNFQFSIFVPLGTPDANRNIVTNFSNIQPLTIYENNFLITIYQPVYG